MPAVISLVLSIILLLFLIWLSWWLANALATALGPALGKWVLVAYYACALIIVILIIAGQIPIPLHLIAL